MCEYCNDKGYNTVYTGTTIAYGDFEDTKTVLEKEGIKKIPCNKCGKWRELVIDKYFGAY